MTIARGSPPRLSAGAACGSGIRLVGRGQPARRSALRSSVKMNQQEGHTQSGERNSRPRLMNGALLHHMSAGRRCVCCNNGNGSRLCAYCYNQCIRTGEPPAPVTHIHVAFPKRRKGPQQGLVAST